MMLRAYMSKTALRRSRTPLQSVSRSSGFLPLGFALLVLFTCPVVEAGQQSTDSSASESPAPKEASATLPQVTVSAQRQVLEKQAHTFVKKLTGSAWAPDEGAHLLGMWRLPVCLIVAGLPREQGEFIFNRVTEVATSAGAHPGQSGCHPNLYIVVTAQPVELLTAWYKRDRRMFEKSMLPAVKRFLARSLPVRIWYNTQLTGEDGSPGTDHGTALGGGLGGTSGQMSATGPLNSNGLMNLLADIPTPI